MVDYYKPVSITDVAAEYYESSKAQEDFQKAKWGTHEGMLNRFRLAYQLVHWEPIEKWLDIGCANGAFFRFVMEELQKRDQRLPSLHGVDVTESLLHEARKTNYGTPAFFYHKDFIELERDFRDIQSFRFDLITLIGVLQQCGSRPEPALSHAASLLSAKGYLFLTTKNLDWEKFKSGELSPYEGHSWFPVALIREALNRAGLQITQEGGFLPRENKITDMEGSHTIFFLACRNPISGG